MNEGYLWRYNREMEIRSLEACWIINRSGFASKATHPDELWKPIDSSAPSSSKPKDYLSKEEIEDIFAYHKKRSWGSLDDKWDRGKDTPDIIKKDIDEETKRECNKIASLIGG